MLIYNKILYDVWNMKDKTSMTNKIGLVLIVRDCMKYSQQNFVL